MTSHEFAEEGKTVALDGAIKVFLDTNIHQQFMPYFITQDFQKLLEARKFEAEKAEVDFSLSGQMISSFTYVMDKYVEENADKARLEYVGLSVVEQLAKLGDENDAKQFFTDERVISVIRSNGDAYLDLLCGRFSHGCDAFTLDNSNKMAYVAGFCLGLATSDDLKQKLTGQVSAHEQRAKSIMANEAYAKWARDNPEEAAARQKAADKLRDEQIAQQTLEREENLRRSQEAIQQQHVNRKNSEEKLENQKKLIAQDPSKFLEFVADLGQATVMPGEISLDERKLGLAAAVALAQRLGDVTVPAEAYDKSLEILTDYLKNTLQNVKPSDSGVTIPLPYELSRVLADIIPDKAALDQWVESYPVILQETSGYDGGFIQSWQDDMIKLRLLKEATADERGLVKKLIQAGVTRLSFEIGHEGGPGYVGYSSREDLLADIKSYFMVRDNEEPHPYGWYRTAEQVFDDVVKKFDTFMISNVDELGNGTPLTFKTPSGAYASGRNGGLYDEQNNFRNHSISIQVVKGGKGGLTYKLMLDGRRYGLVNVQGRLIDSFAAYVGKDVMFDDPSEVIITPGYDAEYGWETGSLPKYPEKQKELFAVIEENRIQPVIQRHDYTSRLGKQYYSKVQTWTLPQVSKRYAELNELLSKWFGRPVVAEYRNENDGSNLTANPDGNIEPWTIVYSRELFDIDGNKIALKDGELVANDTPRRYLAAELGLKKFVVPNTRQAGAESMRRVANYMLYRNR